MLNTDFFSSELPPRPMGKYAHVVMLRVTEGYALFQTDGELNRARVTAGSQQGDMMTRITLFKRKQTTPERLNGRELLRRYSLLPAECEYNVSACKRCPDCIVYGFAIGDGGSEKSKVYADTAFSLTNYAVSHEVFTLNAPYEDGTMSDQGTVTSRINSQDHVKPQTLFPAVLTTRDLTPELFVYVVQNVLRTTRYGATTTRGGTVKNYVVAIVLSDGEIFSNLHFAQRLYDTLVEEKNIPVVDPVPLNAALTAAANLVPKLLAEDSVRDGQVLQGDELEEFLEGIRSMDEAALDELLKKASGQTDAYYHKYVAKPEKSKK